MSTFNDLATDAITALGQLGVGQSMSPEEAQQALRVANRLIAKWSLNRLFLYWIATRQYNLVAAQQNYTFGPSTPADFSLATRPNLVETCAAVVPGSLMEIPMNILDRPKWGAIPDKGAACSANGIPQNIWPEYTYPNLTLHFWPVPSNTAIVKLGTWEVLQQFATIFDNLALPYGYEEALMWNLALELAPYYDMSTSPQIAEVQALAVDGLNRIQQINAQSLGGAFGESQTLYEPTVGSPKPAPGQPQASTGPGGGQ